MRRDELVGGAWYLIKNSKSWEFGKYCESIDSFYGADHVECYEHDVEWVRINPEEIFNGKINFKREILTGGLVLLEKDVTDVK